MVAGPNGSGKSTLIAGLRADPTLDLPTLYINADDLQRERRLADAREAQHLATRLRAEALAAKADVMYETVMSHPAKLAELQSAKAAGYHITVHLVATDDPAINEQRVGARVKAGGHPVAPEVIRARYARTLALAPMAIAYADQAVVFDNTRGGDTGGGLALQAALQDGRLAALADPLAGWVHSLVMQVNARAAAMASLARDGVQLASLGQGLTTGPIVSIGPHYVVQLDAASNARVVHDGILLGSAVAGWAVHQVHRIGYREGVAEIDPAR